MKRIRSILRGREGMTLVELVVGAGLLCLVIGIFSASLRPAAEVSRRTQELNSAELIADDLLETVRSKVETATDYIKCYDSGTDVTNKTGSSEGSAIEFGYETEQGYNAAELLTADGCGPTKIVIADKDSGEQPRVEKGYLVERYYKDGYSQDHCPSHDENLCRGLLYGPPRRTAFQNRRSKAHRYRHRDNLPR